MDGLLLSRETQNTVINNDYGNRTYQIDFSDLGISNHTAMEIIEESKGLNKGKSYDLRSDYVDDGALRVINYMYRNIIKKLDHQNASEFIKRFIASEVGVSFDEFYNNTADIFEITGFDFIFNFDSY